MLALEHGLSRYVLYYWYNCIDEPSYYTKDGILNLKRKFDKSYKWHLIKIWGIIFLFILIAVAYGFFCFYAYDHYPREDYYYITTMARFPVLIIIPFVTVYVPRADKNLLYKRKDFYKTFGKYFKEYDEYKKHGE